MRRALLAPNFTPARLAPIPASTFSINALLCSTASANGATSGPRFDPSGRALPANLCGMDLDDMYNDASPFASPRLGRWHRLAGRRRGVGLRNEANSPRLGGSMGGDWRVEGVPYSYDTRRTGQFPGGAPVRT